MTDAITTGLWVYGGIGFAVALTFVFYGIDRIDAAAKGAYAVRPLLMPGLILMWPIVLLRWTKLARNRGDRP